MRRPSFLELTWCELAWSNWEPLRASPAPPLQNGPGLYRVRVAGRSQLAYLGQTGRSLHERVAALRRGTYQVTPPWNDPHTAAPALWAWRVESALEYEVSCAPTTLSGQERQCFEDQLLYEYRTEVGESTLCNHGWFHPAWSRPSNRSKGRAMVRRDAPPGRYGERASLAPAPLIDEPDEPGWLGLHWRGGEEAALGMPGVYRLSRDGEAIYFGESKDIGLRLARHRQRLRGAAVEASWVAMPGSSPQQRREREADLIGAFFKLRERPPLLQYAPSRE